jgi:hypothetical protein
MTRIIDGTKMVAFSPLPPQSGSDLFVCAADGRLPQPSPTAATVARAARNSKPTSAPRPTSGPMSAPSAGSPSRPANDTTARATVAHAANEPQPSDGGAPGSPRNGSVVPLNDRGYVVPPTVGHCRQCGAELTRKSRNGRSPEFCSPRCRVQAWRARQRAGGE